ncbi:uncharacterized protein LOC144448582 [Glandiceps talaboti]
MMDSSSKQLHRGLDEHVTRQWEKERRDESLENMVESHGNTVESRGNMSETRSFDVITYNILSDFFMDPSTGHNSNYPIASLVRSERNHQLMKELENNKDTDIVCLQEVDNDYFADILQPLMQKLGFHGNFIQDGMGRISGQATFFQEDRFNLVDQKLLTFDSLLQKTIRRHHPELSTSDFEAVTEHIRSPSVMILTKLRCKVTGKTLIFGNIHCWYNDLKTMDVTVMQLSTAINELSGNICSEDEAFFLCGDFNQYPNMPGYHVIQNGVLNETEKEELRRYPKVNLNSVTMQEISLVDIVPKCFGHSVDNFKSSYKEILGHEPNSCFCEDTQFIGALDYICYDSNTLYCQGVLDVVSDEVAQSLKYCPNPVFPSDHFLLRAKLSFL